MPYRIDVPNPPAHAFDRLIDLGALDIEMGDASLAALMPDTVSRAAVAAALAPRKFSVSSARGRDDESTWALGLRAVRTRTLHIVPAGMPASPGDLRLTDGPAFGTGLHPTTRLCLTALEDLLDVLVPPRALDVGTGSGILALAALRRGVPHACGVDTDLTALRVAAENARLNALVQRLLLVCGGVDVIRGVWPLVIANIRAADLVELAPVLVRRVAGGGRLVLSGIPLTLAADVEHAFRRFGMKPLAVHASDGWAALVMAPSW